MAIVPWPGVVKRMHKGQPLLFLQRHGLAVGIRVAVAKQHHFAAKTTHRVDLDLWCGGRHHNHCAGAQALGAQRHALRVVAGGGANYALFQMRRAQVHGLLVFALEQHGVVQALTQA